MAKGISESMVKKGGTKPAPTIPRPQVTPGGKPSSCAPAPSGPSAQQG